MQQAKPKAPKRRLDPAEWTDEAIDKFSSDNAAGYREAKSLSSQSVDSNDKSGGSSSGGKPVEDMDAKIARVNARKREEESRKMRKKMIDANCARPASNLTGFKAKTSAALAEALDVFFDNFLDADDNMGLVSSTESIFPLFMFDSSVFDEMLQLPQRLSLDSDSVFPIKGAACRMVKQEPESSPRDRGLGHWQECVVMGTDAEGLLDVELLGMSNYGERIRVTRFNVCLPSHNPIYYSDRMVAALERRRDCTALLRYHFCIRSMPISTAVASSLGAVQAESILLRSKSMKKLANSAEDLCSAEIATARNDYEFVMNKIMFDADLLCRSNLAAFKAMRIPATAFLLPTKAPRTGLVEGVPEHNMKAKIGKFWTEAIFCSVRAITALTGVVQESERVQTRTIINMIYVKTFSLDKFERNISEQMLGAVRLIKQEWPTKTGGVMRRALTVDPAAIEPPLGPVYDMNIRNIHDYLNNFNPIKFVLERVNLFMGEVLWRTLKRNLLEFSSTMEKLCDCEIEVKDVRTIKVVIKPDSIYRTKVLPPLFSLAFRVSIEDRLLNPEEVDANNTEIAAWEKTPEGQQGDKCPIKKVAPVMGKSIEYNYAMPEFVASVLKVFDNILVEFSDVMHVQKFVMDRIYFPNPRFVTSPTMEQDWAQMGRKRIEIAMEKAVAPMNVYLGFFRKYEDFINTDEQTYIDKRIKVARKDPESSELELPVTVNLAAVQELIDEHLNQVKDIEESLPIAPIACGLFTIEVVSVRELLLDKHKKIVKMVLMAHVGYCSEICTSLEQEFEKIAVRLSRCPENVEELTELEEYVTATMANTTLQGLISDMMAYHGLLDKYQYKVDFDKISFKWNIFGSPAKVAAKCAEVHIANTAIKQKYLDEMTSEQSIFVKTLADIDHRVGALEQLTDLSDVNNIAARVKDVEASIITATSKARLFNSREALFESEGTDYEDLARITRAFEPYLSLWQTAQEWIELSQKWTQGLFVDLNSEEVEKCVDKYFMTVTKANKFFVKAEMKEQAAIAKQILGQVNDFKPEVPLIVVLRNPGMRERHWNNIATQLNVDIMPIEDFTTEQILALNLKNSIELISKIGESAAKEYQIEQALDKMEREWENMFLQIHPYRETGTGVLKGVDDINVVLDEHITMTQTIMFSAFKGPFEERIDEWNRKLCCVSDVLEAWMAVQRNWLYLQPIFESADINRQLPAEGKKFSTVDKGWRQAITAAKQDPKVIDFCDNAKLLERYRESEALLDQVQKGLSDYLETKRSVFARFYFLSNDELLSILSESKDVKLVQPHLKKCFEGIDKVKFLPDLKIDRIISPEGEEIMLSEIIDPVDKNVEVWMLELEGAMRICIRDVMGKAINDYTVTPRPRWMQKWAGMCVLNGSQMHWTTEMEDLFKAEGVKGPVSMYARQIAQLADMTILVRGKLSNASRTTVGALTVIDVHARDVIGKLVDEKVETKDNFGWTSQLRYYFADGVLSAQMVAASRPYGYEYLGNTFRLVITPLTDKCYLTLMGALQMIFGGAPAGPAGTGKTETTKDLAKALAMQCVVFNCSDGLDYIAMGKFFK